jgi:hypothetical protein
MSAAMGPDHDTIDDKVLTVELAEMLEFVADFLARAEGPHLRLELAEATCGSYSLDELRADLRRFSAWLMGEGFA